MTSPAKINFKIYQGSTFKQIVRWESETKTYAGIANISKSAPVQITLTNPASAPPPGWRVRVTNAAGMREINMPEDSYQIVTMVDNDVVELNQINSIGYSTYTGSGVLEYNTPVSLAGYTARMQVRKKLLDTSVILSLTTENGGISLDNSEKTITILITAEQTTELDFSQAVYDLEFISSDGEVTRFAEGNILLKPEVTR